MKAGTPKPLSLDEAPNLKTLKATQVIRGWDEGVPTMSLGEHPGSITKGLGAAGDDGAEDNVDDNSMMARILMWMVVVTMVARMRMIMISLCRRC